MTKRFSRLGKTAKALLFLTAACATIFPRAGRADDGIFPPSPAAAADINFDGRGFIIHGKREFLVSGSLHYARVPRALWRDRLLRMKRAGFNCVQTYAFWNWHEAREGQWDFKGERDLDAFLRLVHDLDMYAIVRVGPYVCAEWDSGGWPVWLRFKPGVRVREDNPEFLKYLDRWYDKVLPIVVRNQIHKGGSVVLVQLENEHPQAWGTEMPNGYFRHLKQSALDHKVEVPFFFSGLHHGSDPAGNRSWDSIGRANPWFTTEFWPGWFDLYGPLSPANLRRFDRGTWKILAYGGNGYNYYMLHGGTNFESYNDDEDASSYDYAGAIGQAGDLRPIYYRFKRAAMLARSFPEILENSTNADKDQAQTVDNAAIKVTARKSDAGTMVFLDNGGNEPLTTQVSLGNGSPAAPLTLSPGEITGLLKGVTLGKEMAVIGCVGRTLGVVRQQNTTTWVLYGPAGSAVTGALRLPAGSQIASMSSRDASDSVTVAPLRTAVGGAIAHFALTVPAATDSPKEIILDSPGGRLRVLVMSEERADRTWFVEAGGANWVVSGPDYVSEATVRNGHLHLTTEMPTTATEPAMESHIYGAETRLTVTAQAGGKVEAAIPTLGAWRVLPTVTEAAPPYNDRNWLASPDGSPRQMGADGDFGAYAWYRATVHAPHAGTYSLRFADAGDRLSIWGNGQFLGSTKTRKRGRSPVGTSLDTVRFAAGDTTLAVLATHYGRDKLFGWLGPLDQVAAKGLNGAVFLATAPDKTIPVASGWQKKTVDPAQRPPAQPPTASEGGWESANVREDVFHGRRGWVWYRVSLPEAPGQDQRFHFENVDDDATVFLNGVRLGTHEGWGTPFDIAAGAAWRATGPNELAVLVRNNDGGGGIMGEVNVTTGSGPTVAITGWRMRGGVSDKGAKDLSLAEATPLLGHTPCSLQTHFSAPAYSEIGSHPIYRVTTTGLSAGFVFLNGHNLGRYPERIPVEGIYLPECWLRPGENELRLFDEEGRSPADVRIVVEPAASRRISRIDAPVP